MITTTSVEITHKELKIMVCERIKERGIDVNLDEIWFTGVDFDKIYVRAEISRDIDLNEGDWGKRCE